MRPSMSRPHPSRRSVLTGVLALSGALAVLAALAATNIAVAASNL